MTFQIVVTRLKKVSFHIHFKSPISILHTYPAFRGVDKLTRLPEAISTGIKRR